MAFIPTEAWVVPQAIATTSTTQALPLGTIVRATDATLGQGEFIYLKGVASTIVGSVVRYDDGFQTALATSAVGGPPFALAVAMSANVASSYGWYQISGLAALTKGAISFADGSGISSASGAAAAVATGNQVMGAVVYTAAASAAATVPVSISRPHGPSDVS